VSRGPCPECHGSRLAAPARASLINGKSIADLNAMQISDLAEHVAKIDGDAVAPLVANLRVHLERMMTLGLGYLSLDRTTSTLTRAGRRPTCSSSATKHRWASTAATSPRSHRCSSPCATAATPGS